MLSAKGLTQMDSTLPSRQIHLDFHTSEHIPVVGDDFDADQFAERLVAANVESVVLFAKCHHGWSYYNGETGERHPNLSFDLLRQQYDACKARGLKVPIYISVGWDERNARLHQDWRQILPDGTFFCLLGRNLQAAWSYMCINSPYLDHLCDQIEEVTSLFPDADGLWLDIIRQDQCCCLHCRRDMQAAGLDFLVEADRITHQKAVYRRYFERSVKAARRVVPDMGVFHNTAMVPRGDRTFFDAFSHLEIESVPTGGWGYDHLPMSAKYLGGLGYSPLGVTVRFHIVWGELGGYRSQSALRYESMAMLTHGCRVCIGDQLDPSGRLDESTYRRIGHVFREIEEKEDIIAGTRNVADVAILSSSAVRAPGAISREERHCAEDEGALRILQDGHFLFDVIDQRSVFDSYRLIILPDRVRLDAELAAKLNAYLKSGGRLLLSGESGLSSDGKDYLLDVDVTTEGLSPYNPTYVVPDPGLQPEDITDPFVMMCKSQKLRAGKSASPLGWVYEPHFNRTPHHFNGHIHAGPRKEPTQFPCAIRSGNTVLLPHYVFSLYRQLGPQTVSAFVQNVIAEILGVDRRLSVTNFPAAGVVTLRESRDEHRWLVQFLFGNPRLKGSTVMGPLEAIDDIPIIASAKVSLSANRKVKTVRELGGPNIDFVQDTDGALRFETGEINVHKMITIEFADEKESDA
jgi:hypothetical protein